MAVSGSRNCPWIVTDSKNGLYLRIWRPLVSQGEQAVEVVAKNVYMVSYIVDEARQNKGMWKKMVWRISEIVSESG